MRNRTPKRIIAALFVPVALLALSVSPLFAQQPCHENMGVALDNLAAKTGQKPAHIGQTQAGGVIIAVNPETGAWSAHAVAPDGSICFLTHGIGWTAINSDTPT